MGSQRLLECQGYQTVRCCFMLPSKVLRLREAGSPEGSNRIRSSPHRRLASPGPFIWALIHPGVSHVWGGILMESVLPEQVLGQVQPEGRGQRAERCCSWDSNSRAMLVSTGPSARPAPCSSMQDCPEQFVVIRPLVPMAN